MTAFDESSNEVAQLLSIGYSATPDAQFAASLLDQLTAEVPVARPARLLTWKMAAAVGAVIASSVAGTFYLRNRVADQQAGVEKDAASAISARRADPAGGADLTTPLGVLSLADRVGRAPVIVRGKFTGWEAPLGHYSVSYVIYGDFQDRTVTIDLSGELNASRETDRERLRRRTGKEPTEADILTEFMTSMGMLPGRDSIIELRPYANHPLANRGVKYRRMGSGYDSPPQYPLQDFEDKIVKVIADGSAFEASPRPDDVLAERMEDAQLIVRAQLVEVGTGESRWKINRVIKGAAKSPTLILDDQFFRQRSRAIVAHAARKQASPSTIQEDTAKVDAETRRLIRTELSVPKEAVLFVDQVQTKPDGIHGRLRHRTYEDQQKQKLNRLQDAISTPDREDPL
jgi:hypothetical protein